MTPDFRALAASGLRTPIGTDLVLHERPDPEAVRLDGDRLAGVVREAALRHRTPPAIPLMDLRLEKADLVHLVRDLVARMSETAHPFILGSECDVLHVPGAGETIRRKVEAMLTEAA